MKMGGKPQIMTSSSKYAKLPARIWNFFGPTSEQIPEIGGHWHDLVRSKCTAARLAGEKTELVLGCRVFQMDGRGSVYVNENKQGGCWGRW